MFRRSPRAAPQGARTRAKANRIRLTARCGGTFSRLLRSLELRTANFELQTSERTSERRVSEVRSDNRHIMRSRLLQAWTIAGVIAIGAAVLVAQQQSQHAAAAGPAATAGRPDAGGQQQTGRGGRGRGVQVPAGQECPPGMTDDAAGDVSGAGVSSTEHSSTTVRATRWSRPRIQLRKRSFRSSTITGMPAARLSTPEGLDGLMAALDELNVKLFVAADGISGANLERVMKALAASPHKDRVRPFTTINFSNVGPGWAEKAVAQLEADVKAGAVGVGEIAKSFGLRTRKPDGSLLKVDDPALDPVWEACARLNIPVFIHTAEPQEFFEPIDFKNERWLELALFTDRRYPAEQFPRFEELMAQRDRLFKKHPKTRFVAAHFGWHANDLARLGKMLDAMPNVYTEMGAILYDIGRQPRGAHDFLVKYQDRVLFGKDAFEPTEYPTYWRVLETDDEYFDYYRDYHAFWKMYGIDLPDAVLKKIYYQNALESRPACRRLAGRASVPSHKFSEFLTQCTRCPRISSPAAPVSSGPTSSRSCCGAVSRCASRTTSRPAFARTSRRGRRGRRGRPGRRRRRAARRRGLPIRDSPGGDPVGAAVGEGSGRVAPGQRGRDGAAPRSGASGRRQTPGLRRLIFGVRQRRDAAEARGHAPGASVALRAAEARRRAVLPDVHEALRLRDGDDAVLQRVRPAATAGVAVFRRDLALHRGAVGRAARRRFTATASRRATSRSSATSSTGVLRACEAPAAAGEVINVAGGGRISLLEVLRTLQSILRTARSSRRSARRARATCATRRPTSTRRGSCSATSRGCRSKTDCGRPWSGTRAAAARSVEAPGPLASAHFVSLSVDPRLPLSPAPRLSAPTPSRHFELVTIERFSPGLRRAAVTAASRCDLRLRPSPPKPGRPFASEGRREQAGGRRKCRLHHCRRARSVLPLGVDARGAGGFVTNR